MDHTLFTPPTRVMPFVIKVNTPCSKTMGHAGAIISGGGGTAKEKIQALEGAGVTVAECPEDVAIKIMELI
jgi:succinyl-CoA synthetase alpha subunit